VTRVLVIDDEAPILRALRINLTARQYEVSTAADGASGLAAMARDRPDVLILDLGLPDMDGTEVIKGVRGWTSTPIIVLSAWGQENQKVAALDAGADDYVTKPFGMDELLARLRAAVRRASPAPDEPVVVTSDFTVDLADKRVTRDGADVRLTPTEWQLLEVLVRSRDRLMHDASGSRARHGWVAARGHRDVHRRAEESSYRPNRFAACEFGVVREGERDGRTGRIGRSDDG